MWIVYPLRVVEWTNHADEPTFRIDDETGLEVLLAGAWPPAAARTIRTLLHRMVDAANADPRLPA